MTKGFFISLEGSGGAGKTTQTELLVASLREKGYSVITFHEPGGTKIGEVIRTIILDPTNINLDFRSEALLLAASRAQLLYEIVRPALARGEIVIADRYIDSSYVYQGLARALGLEEIIQLNDFATDKLVPNLTFLLDLNHKEALQRRRLGGRNDRMDIQHEEFYKAVEVNYRKVAALFPERIIMISGERDAESIHQTILEETLKRLMGQD